MRIWLIGVAVALCAAQGTFANSLFNKEAAQNENLISNKKATFKVGDLITVLVRENLDASTEADTHTKKDSQVNAQAPSATNGFLVNKRPAGLGILNAAKLPNLDIQLQNEHKTTGTTTRTNSLITTISCRVTKVYDNGNLDIKGEKQVTVNREDSTLKVQGTVRARDVAPDNTVSSTQVANAVIDLKGRGPLWNNQRRGLITKILDWFSPF